MLRMNLKPMKDLPFFWPGDTFPSGQNPETGLPFIIEMEWEEYRDRVKPICNLTPQIVPWVNRSRSDPERVLTRVKGIFR